MLKTLRVTSLFTVILTVVGVLTIIALGLKGDPEIRDYLEKPGVVSELRSQIGQNSEKKEKSSPLVALAKKVALRFDPPPPPKPVVKNTPPAETVRVKPTEPSIPRPKGPTSAKFDLLATVVYETAPEKSLALLKTATNEQEWFREGENAGRLTLQEIRDGSVVFDQGTGKTQEIFVPDKPKTQSLLKGDSPISKTGPGSITVSGRSEIIGGDSELVPTTQAPKRMHSEKIRTVRSRSDVSERIQRVRSVPQAPSPDQQKEKVDKTMESIEEIMQHQEETLTAEERKKENELWMDLLNKLNAEKKRLGTAVETNDSPEKDQR